MEATVDNSEKVLLQRRSFRHLLHPIRLSEMVTDWLKEDTPSFDYGGFVVGDRIEKAVLLCKSRGILAGVPFFEAVFNRLDCSVQWNAEEGELLEPVRQVAFVTGPVRNILLGERVALNCIGRASGLASGARRLAEKARNSDGWSGEVAGTRKTTPGFRMVEKYALLVGGLSTHRYDLSSMVMLKDNHIWSAGSIKQAVTDAKAACGFSMKIEVECRSVKEAVEAASAGAHVVMLDNFLPSALHSAAQTIKAQFPAILIEASGGINENNISQYTGPNVDVISLGSATQGYSSVDFSLKICSSGHDPSNPKVDAS